jgi:LmbE family N-acetylglucosaminyl deacetylase
MKKNILVVVAHSDDETISMGGTIRKHITNGDNVIAISMTDGVSSRANMDNKEITKRTDSAEMASQILGFKWGECFNFKDNAMDSHPLIEVIKCIEESKKKYQPNMVYTHSGADLNIDHRIVANAVLTAFRPEPGEICKEIRLFEVPSATDYGHKSLTGIFNPNVFVSIDNEWSYKEEALNAYDKEMRLYPHSRSIQGIGNLARLRGSQVGFEMAEAFEVIRKLED